VDLTEWKFCNCSVSYLTALLSAYDAESYKIFLFSIHMLPQLGPMLVTWQSDITTNTLSICLHVVCDAYCLLRASCTYFFVAVKASE
jgi:hypothetical protein